MYKINSTAAMNAKTICGIALLALATLQACKSGNAEKKAEAPKVAAAPAATEAILLEKQKLSASLQIPGELIAFQQVDIYAKVSSFVRKIYVDVGSQVKQGQLLATMEAPEIGSQLSAAESRLKSFEAIYIASKANYDRLLETSKTPGTISPNDLDLALARQKSDYAQFQAAKASYREVTDNSNYLEIRAPFSGVITTRNTNTGAYVGPSGKGSDLPMFTLQEQGKLRLVIAVPETYIGYLKDNSEVNFSTKAYPGKKFSARVNRMAGALDTRLRSQRIEMDVTNADKKLLPGMIAEVNLQLNANDSSFVVPKSAILNSSTGTYVIGVTNGQVNWIPVQKGADAGGKIEIFGKLQTGDTLVKAVSEEIRDHSVIKVKLSTEKPLQ
ncbi:RND family efflux transporter, MFP subunit [Sediminibacterium ginsengisoli]|uniref:RND family efflux transporter, MFP subunit n=2 Tax=Sediminibacterium ginsengisoli TaxID=413434 RepID=A0A1T4JZ52_9BACT|nr:RND family efflux transporter, MFP subunit [Sediminibacterium ginsengisoli]